MSLISLSYCTYYSTLLKGGDTREDIYFRENCYKFLHLAFMHPIWQHTKNSKQLFSRWISSHSATING